MLVQVVDTDLIYAELTHKHLLSRSALFCRADSYVTDILFSSPFYKFL